MAHMTQTTTCPEISKTIFKAKSGMGLRRYSLHSFIHLSSILHWAWGMDMKCDPVLILKKLT